MARRRGGLAIAAAGAALLTVAGSAALPRVAAAGAALLTVSARAGAIGPAEARPRNVAILLFPGVQIIDYTGPWEVFGHAVRGGVPAFRIYSVAERREPLSTSMGMIVVPDFAMANAPSPDVLVVPGGHVPLESEATLEWIRTSARRAEIVFSVCTGAFLLSRAGLLDGLEATTFAGAIDALRRDAPRTRVVSGRRWVDNGKIITAGGLSAGLDGALHVVERVAGREAAVRAATVMEYDWRN